MSIVENPVFPSNLVLPNNYEFTGEVFTSYSDIDETNRVFVGGIYDTWTGSQLVVKGKTADYPNPNLGIQREANILDSLTHHSIPRLWEADLEAEFPWIITDRMLGSSESCEWFKTHSNPDLAARIVLAALDTMSYVYKKGFRHNDVKESNLVCSPDGSRVALIDFELGSPSGCNDNSSCGTIHYMAPERIGEEPGDISSDLYSLSCLFYAYLYGKLPFDHIDDPLDVAIAHIFTSVDFPNTHISGGDVPLPLREIVEKGLQKRPENRYQSPEEMAESIRRGLGQTSLAA